MIDVSFGRGLTPLGCSGLHHNYVKQTSENLFHLKVIASSTPCDDARSKNAMNRAARVSSRVGVAGAFLRQQAFVHIHICASFSGDILTYTELCLFDERVARRC